MEKDFSIIEAFLNGELSEAERQKVTERAATDGAFRMELTRQKVLRETISETALLQKVRSTNATAWARLEKKSTFEKRFKTASATLAVTAAMTAAFFFFREKHPKSLGKSQKAEPLNLPSVDSVKKMDTPTANFHSPSAAERGSKKQLADHSAGQSERSTSSGWRGENAAASAVDSVGFRLFRNQKPSPLEEIAAWKKTAAGLLATEILSERRKLNQMITLPARLRAAALPDSLLLLRGAFFLEKGDLERAEQDFTRLTGRANSVGEAANWWLGFVYFMQGERQLAADIFESCTGIRKEKADSLAAILRKN